MLLYVPEDYVALVYEGGELRAVVEAGVGVLSNPKGEVQYVYLEPQAKPTNESLAALTLQ